MCIQISVLSSNKDKHKEKFVSKHLSEAQIHPEFLPKTKQDLINLLYTYENAFSSENEFLGAIRGHEVDITLNNDGQYPPLLRKPAYPEVPRSRETFEKHIQELTQPIVLIKLGHNKEVKVTPAIIYCKNDR
ncbi:hypothetical protein O181_054017 [Austropuccinia psidii MF-1]|uniref:Uncharacterized protein n=1 Tax=Austropuccinia psidii MF-1 TaxID=1389203 RepID=A0A9Q3HS34_9BASI|nr:hypothetical protein [Austropuccinia psidii MF-1]